MKVNKAAESSCRSFLWHCCPALSDHQSQTLYFEVVVLAECYCIFTVRQLLQRSFTGKNKCFSNMVYLKYLSRTWLCRYDTCCLYCNWLFRLTCWLIIIYLFQTWNSLLSKLCEKFSTIKTQFRIFTIDHKTRNMCMTYEETLDNLFRHARLSSYISSNGDKRHFM